MATQFNTLLIEQRIIMQRHRMQQLWRAEAVDERSFNTELHKLRMLIHQRRHNLTMLRILAAVRAQGRS